MTKRMTFGSEKLEKTWKRAASVYNRSVPGNRRKGRAFFATTMKIYMGLIRKDPLLTDEYIRVHGRSPDGTGRHVLASSVHSDVANKIFPITLKSKSELFAEEVHK